MLYEVITSEYHQEVCAEYFGDIRHRKDVEILLDTTFEICGFCFFYSQDEDGNTVVEMENRLSYNFV